MKIDIIKCHGSNNDFIIIDEMNLKEKLTEEQRIQLTVQLASRDGIIGSDGTLFVQSSSVAEADAKMRMFNTDGSEAEMCGNGLRCVARYVSEKLSKDALLIETMKANLEVSKTAPLFEDVPTYEVAIEPVSLQTSSLPLKVNQDVLINEGINELHESYTFTAISVPNPHLVAKVDDIITSELTQVGEKANSNKELLPNGVNISFLKDLGEQKVFVQTYERGVGLTNACGTAMSASSLVSHLLGINELEENILVINLGGMVQVNLHKVGEMYKIRLKGNATYEFSAQVDFDFNNPADAELLEQQIFDEEAIQYERLARKARELATA